MLAELLVACLTVAVLLAAAWEFLKYAVTKHTIMRFTTKREDMPKWMPPDYVLDTLPVMRYKIAYVQAGGKLSNVM